MASVKEIKNKVLNAMQEIDLSKLSVDDLQKYVSVLASIDLVAKEPDKTYLDMVAKLYDGIDKCAVYKPQTIGEMKGE
jgi:hypothetical protein